MKKELLAPKYAREFMCTGPKCPETCCQNWNIDIDKVTYQMYTSDPKLIPLVKESLVVNQDRETRDQSPARLKLDPNTGKCTLLNPQNGLCNLHKKLGEDALCRTCAVYPRVVSHLGEEHLLTLSDSCPEAAKALIDSAEALELTFSSIHLPDRFPLLQKTEFPDDYSDRYTLLQGLLTLLRHREIDFEMRLFIASLLIQRADKHLSGEDTSMSMPDLIQMFFNLTTQGYFEEQSKKLQAQQESSLGLVILKVLLKERKQPGAFTADLAKSMMGLGIPSGQSIAQSHLEVLQAAEFEYLQPLMHSIPHAMENLFVNWLLADIFPITKTQTSEGWSLLMVRYLLLKTLLSGYGAYHKKLDKKDLIYMAYRFGRNISHSKILKRIQLELAGNNLNNPLAMARALNLQKQD